ncbi:MULTISPECIES: cell division protein [unclassified Archaeoglobus]|mgnify:CR=1 FL=1|jgi:cell division GTPase FtsZ|uniref:cell division protein n=1 Tax=unclassified Archaeoglobus TaxID=2643606 RepID=UPI0025B81B5D|nr:MULTISPECIES: cell division protein [unclassified Archaeoglobus]
MRLLTIGSGLRGAKIAELLHKKGVKVNRVSLFKCFCVLNNEEHLRSVSLKEDRKFYVHGLRGDVSGFVNKVTSLYEIFEGSLVITSLEDDFGYLTSLELCERLKKMTGETVIALALVPQLDTSSIGEIKKRIRSLRDSADVLILFEGDVGVERKILRVMNLISLAGEIDLKKKVAGEVVVDTSDVFNALRGDGFAIAGIAERKIPLDLKSLIFKRESALKALRTRRMIELTEEALRNVSINGDVETSKSALLLFAGKPEEITMEGLFSSISMIENLNRDIVVRYGDYPIPGMRKLAAVLIFSGIRKFRFA